MSDKFMNSIEGRKSASCRDLIEQLRRCIKILRQLRRSDQWRVTSGEQNTRSKLSCSSLVTRHLSLITSP